VDTAYQQDQPLAPGLQIGGELAPCVLAEDQNRSQRVLRVTYRDRLPGAGICLESPPDVTSHAQAFTLLKASALTPTATTRLLRDMAAR
jgi:hypothetical protein